jgi:hypothetical protein
MRTSALGSHGDLIRGAYGCADFKEVSMPRLTFALLIAFVAAIAAGCGGDDESQPPSPKSPGTASTAAATLPQGSEPFELDPSSFTTDITNPFWPMSPGDRWVYRETDAEGSVARVVVTVLDKTKMIANGVEARIVHDQVREGGEVKEDTFDWYAQDADGNLWYLGEDTAEYENGKLKTREGSWEAGVDGALAGIIMPAHPQVGQTYREEYYKGHAEDGAQIIGVEALAKVPYGRFGHGVQTRNFSGIEPNVIEEKIYARSVGVVLEVTVSGGSDRAELLSYTRG